jgi:hypothetical protein
MCIATAPGKRQVNVKTKNPSHKELQVPQDYSFPSHSVTHRQFYVFSYLQIRKMSCMGSFNRVIIIQIFNNFDLPDISTSKV